MSDKHLFAGGCIGIVVIMSMLDYIKYDRVQQDSNESLNNCNYKQL